MNVSICWNKNYHAVLLNYESRSEISHYRYSSFLRLFVMNVFNFNKTMKYLVLIQKGLLDLKQMFLNKHQCKPI